MEGKAGGEGQESVCGDGISQEGGGCETVALRSVRFLVVLQMLPAHSFKEVVLSKLRQGRVTAVWKVKNNAGTKEIEVGGEEQLTPLKCLGEAKKPQDVTLVSSHGSGGLLPMSHFDRNSRNVINFEYETYDSEVEAWLERCAVGKLREGFSSPRSSFNSVKRGS